jgi:hypothetical protein
LLEELRTLARVIAGLNLTASGQELVYAGSKRADEVLDEG